MYSNFTKESVTSQIFGTPFTPEWIAEKICETAGKSSKIKSHSAQNFAEGKGIMSDLFRLEIQWENEENQLPKQVIIKVPSTASIGFVFQKLDAEAGKNGGDKPSKQMVVLGHKTECDFYTLCAQNSCPFQIPKCYYSRYMTDAEPGILILDDFSTFASCPDTFLNWEQVMEVVDALTTVHSYSIQNDNWREVFLPAEMKRIPGFVKTMREMAKIIVELKPEYFEDIFRELEWCFDEDFLYNHVLVYYEKLGIPPVIVQGDMWRNNLLFHKDSDGNINNKLAGIIDWQLTHKGNCTEDLSRLLFTSVCTHSRQQNTEKILAIYHEELCQKLGKEPFTFEELKKSWQAIFPYATAYIMFNVPLIVNSPALVKGPERDAILEIIYGNTKAQMEDCLKLKFVYDQWCDSKE